jgi:hypothetical protein
VRAPLAPAPRGPNTEPELPAVRDQFDRSVVSSISRVSRPPEPLDVDSELIDAISREAEAQAPAPVPRPQLGRGSTGIWVRRLQRALHSLGYLSRDAISSGPGVFGPRTQLALKAFQDAQGLKPTGELDALTDLALQRAFGG